MVAITHDGERLRVESVYVSSFEEDHDSIKRYCDDNDVTRTGEILIFNRGKLYEVEFAVEINEVVID